MYLLGANQILNPMRVGAVLDRAMRLGDTDESLIERNQSEIRRVNGRLSAYSESDHGCCPSLAGKAAS